MSGHLADIGGTAYMTRGKIKILLESRRLLAGIK